MKRLADRSPRMPMTGPKRHLLLWKDTLLFALVFVTVAACVAFLGLRLQALHSVSEAAIRGNGNLAEAASDLPDVSESRCMDQTLKQR